MSQWKCVQGCSCHFESENLNPRLIQVKVPDVGSVSAHPDYAFISNVFGGCEVGVREDVLSILK